MCPSFIYLATHDWNTVQISSVFACDLWPLVSAVYNSQVCRSELHFAGIFGLDFMMRKTWTSLQIRSISTSSWRPAIQRVTVIGGGLMGSGIAQVCTAQLKLENKLPSIEDRGQTDCVAIFANPDHIRGPVTLNFRRAVAMNHTHTPGDCFHYFWEYLFLFFYFCHF